MEKRKLLLVAVSVGVFLVIVLSAAILIFTPGGGGAVIAQPLPAGKSTSGTPPRPPASVDAADMVRNTGDLQGLKAPPPVLPGSDFPKAPGASASPSASAIQENNFYINGENSTRAPGAERDDGGPAQVVISVPKPSAPGVPASNSRPPAAVQSTQTKTDLSGQGNAPAANPAPASGGQVGTRAVASTAAKPSTAAPTASRAAAAGAAPATAKSPATPAGRTAASPAASRPRTRSQEDYWIQTGAFSALVRAEDAKEILASKGLASIIDDREVDGQIWYRVRVGPYTSENEANYWLTLVRAINGFDQSQIRSNRR